MCKEVKKEKNQVEWILILIEVHSKFQAAFL